MYTDNDVNRMSLDEKVEAVAIYLDDTKPNWHNVLVKAYGRDLATLYVNSPWHCVLSAVYGDYTDGWSDLIDNGLGALGDAIACGVHENNDLRAAWLNAVSKRL